MPDAQGRWDDLSLRVASGVAVLAVGLGAVWLGGPWFMALLMVVTGAIVWEMGGMLAPALSRTGHWQLVGISVGALFVAILLPVWLSLPVFGVAVLVATRTLGENKALYAAFNAFLLIAAFGLFLHHREFGLTWMLWLALVVIVTDVAGYFAGRAFGGPKFWPALSPKKTWSGTLAGWVAAAGVGIVFMLITPAGPETVVYSVVLSFASQLGDLAESWAKRRTGVKDSGQLIPGHGGVWDRFDGMLGAALVLVIIEQLTWFPPSLPGPL
ncbi:MAG: phosphatidate cytidylyltransferase [Pseudomonadota bacterium]